MFQVKEQDKMAGKNEVETGNLPKKDIRVMITKMINKSGEKWIQNENLESFNKELEKYEEPTNQR